MGRRKEKNTLEHYRDLPIGVLNRAGALTADRSSVHTWWRGRKLVASIGIFNVSRDLVRLNYQSQYRDGETIQQDYSVPITWTPCHMGGERPWFSCPDCCRRAAILYLLPVTGRFTCRLCAGLNYASQQQSRANTLIDRAHKLRTLLGCSGGLFRPPLHELDKPRHMRWPKFWETLHQLNNLEQQVVAELSAGLNLPSL